MRECQRFGLGFSELGLTASLGDGARGVRVMVVWRQKSRSNAIPVQELVILEMLNTIGKMSYHGASLDCACILFSLQ